jgi:hypothetical protein
LLQKQRHLLRLQLSKHCSIDTITDGQGNIVERMAYTAFGQRRKMALVISAAITAREG